MAVIPSISGIWQSMRTRSNEPRSTADTASLPFSAMAVVQPRSSSMVQATSIHGIIFRQQNMAGERLRLTLWFDRRLWFLLRSVPADL